MAGVKILLAAPFVAGLLCLAVSAPAHAQHQPVNEGGDYQHCVTYAEFDGAFHLGMREHRVQRVFDIKGRRVAPRELANILETVEGPQVGEHSIVRAYRTCEGADLVLIEFNTGSPNPRSVSGAWT